MCFRFRFVVGTVATLALLTGLFYHIYGFEFLQEAYLYHLTRKDTRLGVDASCSLALGLRLFVETNCNFIWAVMVVLRLEQFLHYSGDVGSFTAITP